MLGKLSIHIPPRSNDEMPLWEMPLVEEDIKTVSLPQLATFIFRAAWNDQWSEVDALIKHNFATPQIRQEALEMFSKHLDAFCQKEHYGFFHGSRVMHYSIKEERLRKAQENLAMKISAVENLTSSHGVNSKC